jgi:hypothetical protein
VFVPATGAKIDLYHLNAYTTVEPGFFATISTKWEGTETIQIGHTELLGLTGVPHVATVTIGQHKGNPCHFQAQAMQQ